MESYRYCGLLMFRFFCCASLIKGCWVLISAAAPVGRKREGKNICRIRLSDTKRARLHVLLCAVITLTHTVCTGTYLSQSYLVISFSVGKLICLILGLFCSHERLWQMMESVFFFFLVGAFLEISLLNYGGWGDNLMTLKKYVCSNTINRPVLTRLQSCKILNL